MKGRPIAKTVIGALGVLVNFHLWVSGHGWLFLALTLLLAAYTAKALNDALGEP